MGLRLNEIAMPVISSTLSVSIAAMASGRNGSFEFSIVAILSNPVASAAFAAGDNEIQFGRQYE